MTVLSKFFSSHSVKEIHRGNIRCFRNFPVWKKIMDERGVYHVFPSEFICLTVPKNIVGEPFGVAEMFWYQIFFR